MEFPDVLPSKEKGWATYIPSRSPEFKVHNTEGLANSAISNKLPHYPCAKYKLGAEGWVKVWEYHPPKNCQWCGGDFNTNLYGYRVGHNILRYPPKSRGKRADLPVICDKCCRTEENRIRLEEKDKRDRQEYQRLREKYESGT